MTNSTSSLRLTKRDFFTAITAMSKELDQTFTITRNEKTAEITPEMIEEFCANELELLDRKNSPDRKPTEKQTANEGLKSAILNYLEVDGGKHTVTDFIKNVPECAGLSQQKISALTRQMLIDNAIEKVVEKRVSYFQLPERV